jgi:ABC-2 type transport system permease protein
VRGSFWGRLWALSGKEILHMVRDVRVIYLALGMPVVMLFLFGYAVTFDLDLLPVGLIDQDRSPASRRLIEAFQASGSFAFTDALADGEAVQAGFRRGDFKAALLIPPGFDRRLRRGEPSEAQWLLDGTDGVTTGIVLGYAAGIAQAENLRRLGGAGLFTVPVDGRVRLRFNPEMKSALFIVPGLIAMILAILAVLLTALTVAREWERGSMEQLFTTPVGRLEVVIGKLLPYLVLGMIQVLLVVTLGAVLFEVPVRGSLLLLFGVALLFLAAMLGQGLLISVLTRNQQVSTQIAMLSSMLPTLLLSGFVFPIENMPWLLQALSSIVPARYFILALRGILLKGVGIDVLWPQILALAAFSLILVLISTGRFRRRLD